MSKKKLKYQDPAMQPPKALMQLVDAFTDTYKPVEREEYADEVFTVRRIREYFQAWPIPKMPDPLPPYLVELERRGFAMQTAYDGHPACSACAGMWTRKSAPPKKRTTRKPKCAPDW